MLLVFVLACPHLRRSQPQAYSGRTLTLAQQCVYLILDRPAGGEEVGDAEGDLPDPSATKRRWLAASPRSRSAMTSPKWDGPPGDGLIHNSASAQIPRLWCVGGCPREATPTRPTGSFARLRAQYERSPISATELPRAVGDHRLSGEPVAASGPDLNPYESCLMRLMCLLGVLRVRG